MPAGYLWVMADPGTQATVEEFNDWYDNEHVPLRMQHIPEFLTGTRYVATDSLHPGWSASYDIESTSLFTDPKYTCLRANRSPREGALVGKLDPLDRRTCETLSQTREPFKAEEASSFLCTIAGEEENGDKGLEGVKGWRRTSRHKIYDSLRTAFAKAPVSNDAPKFVAVYEFEDESYVETPEYKKAIEGATEVRRWKLYKATPNTAQK
ncbi:hypothetical protein P7C70_g7479, partial [Phenoliferia sp. Uapishka_3]